jgi:hypothetical protein
VLTATNISQLTLQGGGDAARTIFFTYDGAGVELQMLQSEGRVDVRLVSGHAHVDNATRRTFLAVRLRREQSDGDDAQRRHRLLPVPAAG